MIWHSPHFGPLREIEGGDDAQTVLAARLGGNDPDGVQEKSERRPWGHALATVWGVWAVWFVSWLAFAPDLTGSFDWVVAGHVMAGERFISVPALMAWSFAIWLFGRRSEEERDLCLMAQAWGLFALAMAPWSFEWGTGWWFLHQLGCGLLRASLIWQHAAWARHAGIERGGVKVLACGAALELLMFVTVAASGWDAGCIYGIGMTCLEGPWVTPIAAELELLGLVLWTAWLTRKLSRGER